MFTRGDNGMPIRVYELALSQTEGSTLSFLDSVIWALKMIKMNTLFSTEEAKIQFDIDIQMLVDFVDKHTKLIRDALA